MGGGGANVIRLQFSQVGDWEEPQPVKREVKSEEYSVLYTPSSATTDRGKSNPGHIKYQPFVCSILCFFRRRNNLT